MENHRREARFEHSEVRRVVFESNDDKYLVVLSFDLT